MSIQDENDKPRGGPFLHYTDDAGQKHDDYIHDMILDEGDAAEATSIGREVALELGLTENEVASLFSSEAPEEKSAGVVDEVRPPWLIDMLKEFDPNQPRDETGKWTSDGGDSGVRPEPAPSKSVGVTGVKNVSGSFARKISQASKRMPATVHEALRKNGATINVGTTVTEAIPRLKGERPDGWPPGSTWDNTRGGYDTRTKQITVAEYRTAMGTNKREANTNVEGLVFHESGHAFWDALGAEKSQSFARAYQKDVQGLSKADREDLEYYVQDRWGPEEAFSEVFANNMGIGANEYRDIRSKFPRVRQWVANVTKTGKLPRKSIDESKL